MRIFARIFGMTDLSPATLLAALALVAGCGTVRAVREARIQQEAWAGRGTGVEAAPPAGKVSLEGWGLPQLVDFAMTNRPSMAKARIAVEDARLALREIESEAPLLSSTPWNAPKVSASVGRSERSRSGRSLRGDTDGGASAELSLDLLVYDFGRNAAAARARAEDVVAAEVGVVGTGYAIFEEVTESYFALLRNEALLEVALVKAGEYAEHERQAETMMENGEAKEVDVLKARLDLAKAEQDVVSASNDVVTAGADLMAALGIDAAVGDFRSVLGARDLGLWRLRKFFDATEDGADALYAVACTNAPAMQVARAKLRAASHQLDVAVADLYPTIRASASLNWADPLWYWTWGLSGAQSLFTGWRRTAEVERATRSLVPPRTKWAPSGSNSPARSSSRLRSAITPRRRS